jgi:hypothetical protein
LLFVDLATLAQVGATLAGFATLAGAIRGTAYDSDAIFDIVAFSLVVMVFSLLGQVFGTTTLGLRTIALGLACSSLAAAVRSIRSAIVAIRDESATYDRTSAVLGCPAVLCTFLAPLIAVTVALNLSPGRAGLLYESALLIQISAAAIMLTDIVRRSLTLRGGPPAA